MIVAVIPAAGEGKRTGLSFPKQFFLVKGVPLIVYPLRVFENHPKINEIIVVTSYVYINYLKNLISECGFKKIVKVVSGGPTRQASVWAGVKIASKNTEVFLVHDAVRPFISKDLIDRVIEATLKYQAAIPATPVRDTLTKEENGWLKKNFSKESLYHLQTPQGIKAEILRKCLEQAERENLTFSDESSLLLYFGHSVKMVKGSFLNFKITYYEDLLLAQKLIESKITSLLESSEFDGTNLVE